MQLLLQQAEAVVQGYERVRTLKVEHHIQRSTEVRAPGIVSVPTLQEKLQTYAELQKETVTPGREALVRIIEDDAFFDAAAAAAWVKQWIRDGLPRTKHAD